MIYKGRFLRNRPLKVKDHRQRTCRDGVRAKRARAPKASPNVLRAIGLNSAGVAAAIAAVAKTSLHVAMSVPKTGLKPYTNFGLNSKIRGWSNSCTDQQYTKRPASISTHIFVIPSQYRNKNHQETRKHFYVY